MSIFKMIYYILYYGLFSSRFRGNLLIVEQMIRKGMLSHLDHISRRYRSWKD